MSLVALLNSTCPWIIPGHVMERIDCDNPNAPHIVVLEVDRFREGKRAFVARTCNVIMGTYGTTTTAPIYESRVGEGPRCGYRIIGVLSPKPKEGDILEGVKIGTSKVLDVEDGCCVVRGWDKKTRDFVSGSKTRTYMLDDTFWRHFKVFWPRTS